MIDSAGGTMNPGMFSVLLNEPNSSLTPIRRLFSCMNLILILMIPASCEMPGEDKTSPDTTPRELPNANYGYANSSLRYFYYPEDKTIYYISGNAVHKMDVDGRNSTVIKSNAWKNPPKKPSSLYPFIFVSNGTVYYNDGRRPDDTTYRMKTDGTDHKVERRGKSGPMGVYGTGKDAMLYFDDRQQYLKNDTRYFSSGPLNLSRQTAAAGGSTAALTDEQADNFVLTPRGIYFRLRAAATGVAGAYGIVKVGYDAVPEVTGGDARLKNADMEKVVDPDSDISYRASSPTNWVTLNGPGRINAYDFNTLNVSGDFIAYIGRSIDNSGGTSRLLPGGLNVVSRNAGTAAGGYGAPRTLRAGLRKFDLRGGGIDIIGDYLYWLTEDKDNQRYELHRIRKDGTGYGMVKHIPY